MWLNKLSLHWHSVERGDLIVFWHPCQPALGDIEEKLRKLLPGAMFRTATREPTAR